MPGVNKTGLSGLRPPSRFAARAVIGVRAPVRFEARAGIAEAASVGSVAGATPEDVKIKNKVQLISSVSNGDIASVLTLIQAGVDVKATDNDGMTLLHLASSKGHTEVAKLLIARGAEVNTSTNNGKTPVFIAAKNGHANVIQLLAKLGADVNKSTNNGKTPAVIAAENCHTDALQALHDLGAKIDLFHHLQLLKNPIRSASLKPGEGTPAKAKPAKDTQKKFKGLRV